MSDLNLLIYLSRATTPHTAVRLREWCEGFAAQNQKHNVTGLLLSYGDHFIQILEGDKPELLTLMANIRQDPRNTDFRLLFMRPAAHRRFGDWAMSWVSLDQRLHISISEFAQLRSLVRLLIGSSDPPKRAFMQLISALPKAFERCQMRAGNQILLERPRAVDSHGHCSLA